MALLKLALLALLLAVAGFAVWVRVAPSDPARWHTDPGAGVPGENSHTAALVLGLPPEEALAAFDAVAMAEPRTRRLAGSPAEGRITYVTRSRFWGFPDYTTVAATHGASPGEGARLEVHARARFGRSDLGVNAARVGRWLAALSASAAQG